MIGGLQGEFGDLDNKYLKQSISKYLNCRSHISGSFRRTPRHCGKYLRNSSGKRCQRIWICCPEKLKRPPLPSDVRRRMRNIRMECRQRRIPDVRHPGGMSTEQNFGCETFGWNGGVAEFRMWYIRVGWRRSRIPDGMSAVKYPDGMSARSPIRICCPNEKDPRSTVLRWCVRTPCPDIFCHGFQRTLLNLGLLWWSKSYQNTKT